MPAARNIAFLASETDLAEEAKARLEEMYGRYAPEEADVIVALGGDGFMLSTLHATQEIDAPVYGMNRGTVGFLMNAYREDDLIARLEAAEEEVINPLHMWAERVDGSTHEALAINEVSLLRAGPQAAKLRIYVDGRLRMEELVCDGALVCTPAGSTAYNYSAHGPILLFYHENPKPGKTRDPGDQADGEPAGSERSPIRPAWRLPAGRSWTIRRRPPA
jgi:NAD+ kinase